MLFDFNFHFEKKARLTDEQRHEFEKKIVEECKGPSQATDEDVSTLLSHEIPQTRTGKCLLACAKEKLGVVRMPNGIYDDILFDNYFNAHYFPRSLMVNFQLMA